MIKKLKFTLLSLVFMSTGIAMSQGTQPNGSGSSVDPYKIATKENLLWLSQNSSTEWDAVYEQTADILFEDADFESSGDFYNNSDGFLPIGDGTTNFTGSYDGQGNTIDGLFIDRSSEALNGLFGYIGDGGEVTNLGVANVNLTGQNQMGGLAGRNNGRIENSFTTGVVDGGERTGGLVGHNEGTGTIENSYSGTEVIAGSQGNQEKIGGLVGDNSNASIKKSYSFGVVDQAGVASPVGGLSGREDGGDAENADSFWDTQTSGQSSSGGGTGKTTSEMQDVATFTNESTSGLSLAWDFVNDPNNDLGTDDIWNIDASINDGYPHLDKVVPKKIQFVLNSPADGSTGIPTPTELDVTVTSSSGNPINIEFFQVSGWDIDTASYDEIEIDTQDTGPEGIHFSADGETMYVMGYSDEEVYQFDLATPWDLSTAVFEYSQANVNANSTDLFISPDGTNYYELEKADGEIHWMDMVGGEINTVDTQNINATISTQSSDPEDIYFSPDGTMLYELSNSSIYEYELSTAWDISTATYSNVSISTQDASSTGLFFHPDGEKMYELGDGSNQLHQFSLSTAWDLSTATPDNISIDLDHGDAHSLFFNPTGTQLYYVGRGAERAYSYSLNGTGEIIASVSNVDSGSDATHTWEGLDELTHYEWYATANDGSTSTTSDSWSFRTGSPIKWTGATDSQWNTSSNWLENNTPINSDDVLILGTATNMPIVSTDVEINNLEIESNADLTINPDKILKVNHNITNNGQITFKSDATGDSYLDEFTGSITGTGDVVVEKYYPAKRAFRMVASPVDGGRMFDNWQNGGANEAGIGTHITGGSTANGFDQTATGNPSMFEFITGTGWQAIANTNATNLTVGTPYRLMIRGDRDPNLLLDNNATPNPTTLIATGELKVGTESFNFPSAAFSGTTYAFVANPYQSRIDVSSVLTANTNAMNDKYWVWDPMINTRGGFVLVAENNNTWGLTPSDTTNTSPFSTVPKFIEPGQAFFIQLIGTDSNISFTESVKDNTTSPKPAPFSDNQMSLLFELQNEGNQVIDAIRLRFATDGITEVDAADIAKMG
ncbi:WD40 repeat domain-containing protein, partial [Psychroflexus sp. C1]|nr:WD40 repeat domain-containing protein [Psychroflexus maritimus]